MFTLTLKMIFGDKGRISYTCDNVTVGLLKMDQTLKKFLQV